LEDARQSSVLYICKYFVDWKIEGMREEVSKGMRDGNGIRREERLIGREG
jgi:hypothetical protein